MQRKSLSALSATRWIIGLIAWWSSTASRISRQLSVLLRTSMVSAMSSFIEMKNMSHFQARIWPAVLDSVKDRTMSCPKSHHLSASMACQRKRASTLSVLSYLTRLILFARWSSAENRSQTSTSTIRTNSPWIHIPKAKSLKVRKHAPRPSKPSLNMIRCNSRGIARIKSSNKSRECSNRSQLKLSSTVQASLCLHLQMNSQCCWTAWMN